MQKGAATIRARMRIFSSSNVRDANSVPNVSGVC
jgi:hypothetical protein